mmetsp:Transcript_24468/g.44892  ORF Transcript_24468/g.44892 Transcript_24468/m.44892 type:complete len:194 (-) Transcript_24468:104-685(-)
MALPRQLRTSRLHLNLRLRKFAILLLGGGLSRLCVDVAFMGAGAGDKGGKAPSIGDLMGAMPKAMEAAKNMQAMQEKMKAMPMQGSSLDGRVNVTVSGALVPLDVAIDGSLMTEVTAEELSAGVLEAMQVAHNKSAEYTKTQITELYGNLGLGGAVPGAGAAAPAPAAKPVGGGEDLAFDPINKGAATTRSVD